ncbi:acyl-CoA Delta-9 desaturase-like [Periplaneta americana]|uniref:acyl-CoA Delta-9 desaturase-like n=1 Tax=Periplaneta americana TaxID=6978 RepID=UPI0037E792D6
MTPNTKTDILSEEDEVQISQVKPTILWFNVVLLAVIHIMTLYGLVFVLPRCKWQTLAWDFAYSIVGGFGVTAGAHRLWTHRSYKAKLPLRVILALLYPTAGMNSMYNWVRDHRVHHKYSDTDADPHNASRGLFFSHVGWLMCKKHPEVRRRGRHVDMTDVEQDPVIVFQEKYFGILVATLCFAVPITVPYVAWGETLWNSAFSTLCRWVISLNCIWAVNSFAHIYGYHPYNRNINPAENKTVSVLALGEGWHNYHHTFPWDYKTAEFGNYGTNFTTAFIDFFAYVGWAYDLKQPSEQLIQKIVQQSGDGTHLNWGSVKEVPHECDRLSTTKEDIKGR